MKNIRYPFDDFFFEHEIKDCNARELGAYCRTLLFLARYTRHIKTVPAIRTLGIIKDGRSVSLLIKLLGQQDAAIICEAVDALGNLRASRASSSLQELLQHDDVQVRHHAAAALENISATVAYTYRAPRVYAHIIEEVVRKQRAIFDALSPEAFLPTIIRSVKEPNAPDKPFDPYHAVHTLEGYHHPHAATALQCIAANANDQLLAMYAATALGRMGKEYPIGPFVACMREVVLWLPDEAIDAVVELKDQRLIPSLVSALDHRRVNIREMAGEALSVLTSEDCGWDMARWRLYLKRK